MPRKLSIMLFILSIILIIFFSINFFYGPFKRIILNYKNTLTGSNVNITIYSSNGSIIKKYTGKNTYIKSTEEYTEIHLDGKKYFFSNISLIIEEI